MAAAGDFMELSSQISQSKLFVVGAGGIGCELLKNIVLTGFKDIHVIDLDTIDVSNLNRQFLFRKEHVGKPKSQVARYSVLQYQKDTKITAYHDSIFNTEFGTQFYKQFNVVLNALDNRAARNHVNRMCLAAKVPLVEAGTAGYLGQVQVIQRGVTECYECQPKPAQKTFPGCTIRNTPSEPIHCIVWAKHLFNQLFGEDDPDQDVSPDSGDPENVAKVAELALQSAEERGDENLDSSNEKGKKSTRSWAVETGYNSEKLFNKLFCDDVKYLLSMKNLWKKREPPEPLQYTHHENDADHAENGIQDQKVWSLVENIKIFSESLGQLKVLVESTSDGTLTWDKDDKYSMDFVASAANLRMTSFHISTKSRFEIKSMAGNIIPAIASTNAIIAGVQVMECLKIISGQINKCKSTYLVHKPGPAKLLLNPCQMDKPNPKCYVCSEKPEVLLQVNPKSMDLATLRDKVLISALNMQAPDIELDDGRGTILISSDGDETADNESKTLADFGITEGNQLKCDDFLQDYTLVIIINSVEQLEDGMPFNLVFDKATLHAKPAEDTPSKMETNSDEEPVMVEQTPVARKRPVSFPPDDDDTATKRARLDDN